MILIVFREVAHRVLMPAFGPLAIENLFDGMHDIAKQFILKWARAGPQEPLCATDDFTRLTLDSKSSNGDVNGAMLTMTSDWTVRDGHTFQQLLYRFPASICESNERDPARS